MKRLTTRKYTKVFLLSKDGKEWVRHIAVPEDDWRDIMRMVNAALEFHGDEANNQAYNKLADAITAFEGKK